MIRFAFLFLIMMAVSIRASYAHDFTQIQNIFDYLQNHYNKSVDYKQLSLESGEVLHSFDNNIKLYYSDSKAFLYEGKKLVRTLELPKENAPKLWQQVLNNIILTGYEHSNLMKQDPAKVENQVLQMITKHLDVYSRVETNVYSENMIDYTIKDNVLYIKAPTFYHGYTENLKNIVSCYSDVDGVILDLRGNRGGYFDEAIKTADLFLDDVLIAYSVEKNQPKRFYTASKGDILEGKSIAVLTDETTASAAEIVVAALSEQGRAVVIGTRTFGKGTIQQKQKLGASTLYLTNGQFFSPSGKSIQGQGIMPQICTNSSNNCLLSDKTNPQKDIITAIRVIQNTLS